MKTVRIFAVRLKKKLFQKVNALKEYRIPFIGLKLGTHEFQFTLKDKFFETFEYSQIESGEVEVEMNMEKQSSMLILKFNLHGNVDVLCDRCGDPISQPISGTHQLIVKFGNYTSESDDDVLVLGPSENEIDISQFLYEYSHLDLPVRHVHQTLAECNQDVLKQLQKYSVEDDADNKWIALKNMQHDDGLLLDEFFDEEE